MTQNWPEVRKVGVPQSGFRTHQCWSRTNLDKDHKWPSKHHLAFDLSNMSFELLTNALLKYYSSRLRADIGIGKIILKISRKIEWVLDTRRPVNFQKCVPFGEGNSFKESLVEEAPQKDTNWTNLNWVAQNCLYELVYRWIVSFWAHVKASIQSLILLS